MCWSWFWIFIYIIYPGTSYAQQSYKVSDSFPFKWINKKWNEGFHVTSMTTAGSQWGIVMSRNSGYSDQVSHLAEKYHFTKILWEFFFDKKTVIGSKVVELDFLYPSEGIHKRWQSGYRITSVAATADQAAFILSLPKRKIPDETQETLRTSAFPSTHVKVLIHFITSRKKILNPWFHGLMRSSFRHFVVIYVWHIWQEKWSKNLYIGSICYGRTVSWQTMKVQKLITSYFLRLKLRIRAWSFCKIRVNIPMAKHGFTQFLPLFYEH